MDIQSIKILFIILLISLVGCAKPSTSELTHTPGTFNIVQNEILVEKPIDYVWNKLKHDISKYSEFEIITSDDELRVIQASFYSVTPCQYINCGFYEVKSEITIPGYDNKPKEYTQEACEKANYQLQRSTVKELGSPYKHEVVDTFVDTFMEGIATVSLLEVQGGTSVMVDVQYNMSFLINNEINTFDSLGEKIKSEELLFQDECRFTTLMDNKCNKLREIICSSKGTLEKLILDLVER